MKTAQEIINEIEREEQELKSLFKARMKSKDKQFIMDTYAYEEILNEDLEKIRNNGIDNNRRTREKLNYPTAEEVVKGLE